MDINNLNAVNSRVVISDRQIINENIGNALKSEAAANNSKSAMTIIKSLTNGDIFNAEVTDIKGNAISIMLDNSTTLTANLLNALSINIGDRVRFMVQDNTQGSILLKALEEAGGITDNTVLLQALENAGLPDNESNRELVLNLMRNNMPINKDTVVNLARTMNTYPQNEVSDVLTLMRLGIEVDENSLKAYSNYKEYNSAMLSDISVVAAAIKGSVSSGRELMDIALLLSDENVSTQTEQDGIQNNSAQTSATGENIVLQGNNAENKLNVQTAFVAASSDFIKTDTTALKENLIKELEVILNNNNQPVKIPENMSRLSDNSFMAELGKLLAVMETVKGMEESTKSLYKSPNIERLIDIMVRNSLAMPAGDIAKPDAVKENIVKAVEKIEKLIAYSEESGNRLINDSANSMRNNMEFLNNLNQFVAAAQIPLKHLGDGGEGELYVYRRGRKGSGNEDETLKAFLHLNMQHLGALDIYVTLTGNNVSTNFCVEDESILDFLEAHMHILTQKLNDKGYNVSTQITDGEEVTGFDFVKEVVAPNLPVNEIKRFKFDVKA